MTSSSTGIRRRAKAVHWVLIALLFSLLTSIACSGAEPIKIAAIFAKTGIAGPTNLPAFRGTALAAEEINRKGGILGHPLEVIELDNKSTPLGSKQAAQEALKLGVTAVIGAIWSAHSLAMAPVLQNASVPMISPSSTNQELTQAGGFIFRVCFTDSFQGSVMAHFAAADLKAATAVVLVNVSSPYSMDLADLFIRSFTALGNQVLWKGKYREKAVDFTEILDGVRKHSPDVVFLPGYARDSALILKQATAMGIQIPFLGGDGWDSQMFEIAGSAIEGKYYCSHWSPDVSSPRSQLLKASYRQKYGEDLKSVTLALAYDAAVVLADAIGRAGSLDGEKIRDALAATRDFPAATGSISFDESGNPINKQAVILKLQGGRPVFVKTFRPGEPAEH